MTTDAGDTSTGSLDSHPSGRVTPPIDSADFKWTTGGNPSIEHRRCIYLGNYTEVHELSDTVTKEVFARKLVHTSGGVRVQEALGEQRAIVRLCLTNSAKENVVQVLRNGWLPQDRCFYLDMELCDFNLDCYIYQKWDEDAIQKVPHFVNVGALGPLAAVCQTWNILIDISSGVAFIHENGYVHRDLKPYNVLYACNQKRWKVGDFGISAEGSTDNGISTIGRGTQGYRPPELLREVEKPTFTNKCDIWAIGVILYELLHKKKPFGGDEGVQRYYVMSQQGKSMPLSIDLPSGFNNEDTMNLLSQVIHDTLNLEPSKRPPARDLVKIFKNALLQTLSEATGTASLERACSPIPLKTSPMGTKLTPTRTLPIAKSSDGEAGVDNAKQKQPESQPIGTNPPVRGFPPSSISMLFGQPGPSSGVGPSGAAVQRLPEATKKTHDRVLKTLESTLETRKHTLGPGHITTLRSMKTLADHYFTLGYTDLGVMMFAERVQAASEVYKPEDQALLLMKNDLALAYSKVKKFAEAAKVGEEINAVLPRAYSSQDANFLTMRYNLGYYYEFLGKLTESAAIYEEVITSFKWLKDDENRTLKLAMTGLESVYVRLGRYNDAITVCEQILGNQERSLGEENPLTLWTMKILAGHYKNQRRPGDAVRLYSRILTIKQRTQGPEHLETLTAMSDLAAAYLTNRQQAEAETLLEEALEVRQRVQGKEHPDTLQAMDDLAMLSLTALTLESNPFNVGTI